MTPARGAFVDVVSNPRLKLPARGGRSVRERSFLSAAAAGRSLGALR
jgi:hypothetical protein